MKQTQPNCFSSFHYQRKPLKRLDSVSLFAFDTPMNRGAGSRLVLLNDEKICKSNSGDNSAGSRLVLLNEHHNLLWWIGMKIQLQITASAVSIRLNPKFCLTLKRIFVNLNCRSINAWAVSASKISTLLAQVNLWEK